MLIIAMTPSKSWIQRVELTLADALADDGRLVTDMRPPLGLEAPDGAPK
jgi:hypothetical protein